VNISQKDRDILRSLGESYARIACSKESLERAERFRRLNSLERVRPPVLLFEVPWGEFSDCDELRLLCEDEQCRNMERQMRSALYQWEHFQGDYALHPYWRAPLAVRNSGVGLKVSETTIESMTGTNIMSHAFHDLLPDEESLDKIKTPEITHDTEASAQNFAFAGEIFRDILPVKKAGITLYFASWDVIPRLHGVENSLMDLCARPEFAHALIARFTEIHEHELSEYERLNVLDTDPYYLHCTPACTYDLPVKDMDKEQITAKDVWCRAMAQIFSMVSPEMHEEFDLQYTKRLFDRCGLSYYGCCEPLDVKVDNLRQFQNLRRISVTTWANPDVAAEKIGGDYVMSYKPNPAFVAGKTFNPSPVEAEITRVMEASKRNNTPVEFVLKDISTVSANPSHLTQWVTTANAVIDRYF
jgi:hypothetical protein